MTSPADRLYRERFITQTVGNVTTTGHGARTEIKLVLGDAGDERNYSYRKWLAPWLYKDWKGSQAQRLSNLCQRATAGTGGWLIDKALPDLLGGEADNLCLHGRVGSGKSTLCALAVQANRVSAKVSSSQWNGLLVPALFAFDLEYTHNSEFLLRTIMAQFCTLQNIPSDIVAERKTGVDPSAIPDILDLTTSIIKQLDEQAETRNCQRDDGEGNSAKSIPVTLVLDALDELPARTQRAVWNIFDHLSTLNRTLRHIRIRIILFVRTDSLIHDYYANNRGWAMHAISKTRVNADIRTTVTGRLADQPSLRFMNPTDRKQVVDAIADRVDGMFRLAALYCDEIDRLQRSTTTANEVLNLVSTLPNQLYDFYDRILERVTDRKLQKYIVRTLWFLRVDGRNIDERVPVTLSIISYQSWYSWFIKMVDDPVSSDDILKPLNGLVTRHSHATVELAHFSVAEYLESAASRKTLCDLGWQFPRNKSLVSDHYRLYLRILAFRILRIIDHELLAKNEDGDKILFWFQRKVIATFLSARTTMAPPILVRSDWERFRVAFDIVTNIACAYVMHPRRCWSSSLLTNLWKSTIKEERGHLFASILMNLALWCHYYLASTGKMTTWDFTNFWYRRYK